MFDELTIKILVDNKNTITYYINEGFTEKNMEFELLDVGIIKKYAVDNGKSYFTTVFSEDGFDVVAYLSSTTKNYKNYFDFLTKLNQIRLNKNLSPIQIIQSSTEIFTIINDITGYTKHLTIRDIYMNIEIMSEDEIMTDLRVKVCRALRCSNQNMIIIDIENSTIKMRVPNNYKIIYPGGKYKRKTLYIDHSRENVLKELVKEEPRIQIVRIIKKGDNRYHVYVLQKISQQHDSIDTLSDFTQLDATSPTTPRAGKISRRDNKRRRNKKSKKR